MVRATALVLAVWILASITAGPVAAQPGTGDINLNNNNAPNTNSQGTYQGSNANGAPNPGSALPPITRPRRKRCCPRRSRS